MNDDGQRLVTEMCECQITRARQQGGFPNETKFLAAEKDTINDGQQV